MVARGANVGLRPQPFPAGLRAALPTLRAGLGRTREALLAHYIQRLRDGHAIAGGATSDAAWTLGWRDGSFVRRSSRADERVETLSEAEVRAALLAHGGLGLGDAPA